MKKVTYIFFSILFIMAALTNAQTLDSTFDAKVGGVSVRAIALQPDSKILIGGSFTSFDGVTRHMVARLNPNSSLDKTFGTAEAGNPSPFHEVDAMALQPDGKVLIGGKFSSYNGANCNKIARLNPDGLIDTTFHGGINGYVYAMALQHDSKIIVGGDFSSMIVRLNSNGTIDTTFKTGTEIGQVRAMALQPDGKILIGGFFSEYKGTKRIGIARLNRDGSLDTSFKPGTGENNIALAIALQSDGKVLIGGRSFNGTSSIGIGRLNRDGSFDNTFVPGSGTENNSDVYTITLQPNGKILIGGSFTSYNGTSRKGVARLNSDGILDTTFDPETGTQSVFVSALQSDGKIIIGGGFTSYNGTSRQLIARLKNNSFSKVSDSRDGEQFLARVFPVPTHGNIFITTGEQTAERIDITTILGQVVASIKPSSPQTEISLADQPKGIYFVTIASKNVRQTFKLVKVE